MSAQTKSAIYVGRVSHTRRFPVFHRFAYRLSMLYLDLEEVERAQSSFWLGFERWRPLTFRRRDYLGHEKTSLSQAVRQTVLDAIGIEISGPIRLLTQVRALGYVFNPVSFYYCFSPEEQLVAVVTEITNTPWSERHRYVLDAGASGVRASFEKRFHVSPFFGMDQRYRWRLTTPEEKLGISMTNDEGGTSVFSASLVMKRKPMTSENLRQVFARAPFMSLGLHAAIYFQALRLWLKRAPFFPHPDNSPLGFRSKSHVRHQRTVRSVADAVPALVHHRKHDRRPSR